MLPTKNQQCFLLERKLHTEPQNHTIVCNLASFPPILTIEEKDLKEEIIDRWAEF